MPPADRRSLAHSSMDGVGDGVRVGHWFHVFKPCRATYYIMVVIPNPTPLVGVRPPTAIGFPVAEPWGDHYRSDPSLQAIGQIREKLRVSI